MGHSFQLLNNVYIQQLKGQQILGKRGQCQSTCSTHWSHVLSQWVLQVIELHTSLDSTLFKFIPHLGQVRTGRVKCELVIRITKWQERENAVGVKVNQLAEMKRQLKGRCGKVYERVSIQRGII